MRVQILLGAAALLACGACGSGMGKAVRSDIEARMASARPAIEQCYAAGLTRKAAVNGSVQLQFEAEAKTGQFVKVKLAHSNLNDPETEQCLISEVGKLKLEKPQKTVVAVDNYPIRFTATQ